MSTFAYTAIGRDGRQASGTVSADTRSAAIAQVVRQGMHPLRIDEQGKNGNGAAAAALWARVHDDVVGGESLANALAKWPRSFSGVYVAMVRAGEAGGFLDVVLGQIAEFRAREADLKGKVKASLVYPVFLAALATLVVVFLLTWFIPKFSTIFAELGGNLPTLTLFIIAA